MTLRFQIYCKTPFYWFYFFCFLQPVCINLTEVPLWIYHVPVRLAIKFFYSQKTQTLAQTTFFCFLMTLYLIFLPIIQPHYSLSLQPVLIRNTNCNEKSLWAWILTTHRCPVSVCACVCVCDVISLYMRELISLKLQAISGQERSSCYSLHARTTAFSASLCQQNF